MWREQLPSFLFKQTLSIWCLFKFHCNVVLLMSTHIVKLLYHCWLLSEITVALSLVCIQTYPSKTVFLPVLWFRFVFVTSCIKSVVYFPSVESSPHVSSLTVSVDLAFVLGFEKMCCLCSVLDLFAFYWPILGLTLTFQKKNWVEVFLSDK